MNRFKMFPSGFGRAVFFIISFISVITLFILVIAWIANVSPIKRNSESNKVLSEFGKELKIQIETLEQVSNVLASVESNLRKQTEKKKIAAERLNIIDSKSFEDYCNKNKTSPEEFIVQEVGGQVTIKFNDLSSKDQLVGIIQTKAKIDLLANTPLEAIQIVDFKERVTVINPDERFAGYIQVENTGFSLVPLIIKK